MGKIQWVPAKGTSRILVDLPENINKISFTYPFMAP